MGEEWDVVTEAEIRKDIAKYLSQYPERCLFTLHVKPRGKFVSKHWPPPGWSDISGVWDGRGLFIEVKTPTGRTISQDQIKFIDRARAMGHFAFFANCIGDVQRELGLGPYNCRATVRIGTEVHEGG